jgi:hypothetical protein
MKKKKVSKTTVNNKEYKLVTNPNHYEIDWDYGWNFNHKSRYGNLSNHKWREFKTWKHNRKTQYKNETKT